MIYLPFRQKKEMLPCCPPAKRPASPWWVLTDIDTGVFVFLVTWFGREWMKSSVLGSVCAWNISVGVVADVSYWMRLLSSTKVVMLKTVELLFWLERTQTLLVAVVVNKMLWGGNISFCAQEVKSTHIGCVLLGIKEDYPTVFVLDMKCLHILTTELVAAATWPLLWGAFHLFLLFCHLQNIFLIVQNLLEHILQFSQLLVL